MSNINELKSTSFQKISNSACVENKRITIKKGEKIDSFKYPNSKQTQNQISCQEIDNYHLISLFEKNIKKIKNRKELEDAFPKISKCKSSTSKKFLVPRQKLSGCTNLIKLLNPNKSDLYNLEIIPSDEITLNEINDTNLINNKTLNLLFKNNRGKVDLSNLDMESNIDFVFNGTNDYDKSSSLVIELQKSPNTVAKIISIKALINLIPEEKKEGYMFEEHKILSINANLILKHSLSFGEIYLGSNQYKYKTENLKYFNVIINVIGELPENTLETKDLNIEILENRDIKYKVMERIVTTKLNHKINFYVLEKESFVTYPYLCEVIHNHFLKGDKILLHCEQGLIRSAGLLLFYLRKYLFDNIADANRFIGIKRDLAGASTMVFPIIERLVKI